MPQPSAPPNREPLVGADQRISPVFQQWFQAMWRALVPERTFYVPTTSGAPSFTPESRGGFSPVCFDPATGILYAYDGSSWLSVTLS